MKHWTLAIRALLLAPLISAGSWSLVYAHGDASLEEETLEIVLREWSLGIEVARVSAGAVRVRAVNEGKTRHNLTVTEAGTFSEIYQTRLLGPGETVELSLVFLKGQYDLYCAVPGHRNAGMLASIVVGEAVADVVPISGRGYH